MEQTVTIVIPVYKDTLTEMERISFARCCEVLGKYPVSLVTPAGMDISAYREVAAHFPSVHLGQTVFDRSFFTSVQAYNRLMLSKPFYEAFREFAYMLVYQLDAYVFRDELAFWCSKGYDYIGAPWFRKIWKFQSSTRLWAAGNGGFSLRKIDACLRILDYKGKFKPCSSWFRFHNSVLLKLKKLPFGALKSLPYGNTVDFYVAVNRQTEDMFWAMDTAESYAGFRIAPVEEAIRFAFECHPSFLYTLNGEQLPFGCHAWNRYEPDFWKRFIPKEQPEQSNTNKTDV